ncbi:hypothetical protein L210DRAFT_3550008 [Boletus edulis BED1]|uniref:Uncharacterized protein n=1 Tax=Boletus edulis BED1 TaxID=1328754 RepID=A0AAD4BNM4_BOLED|nr:hypothetical protein L210DRAFT_3550008 [Boletus edulis BED1]
MNDAYVDVVQVRHIPQTVIDRDVKSVVRRCVHLSLETKVEMGRGFLPRPRVAGEVGCRCPDSVCNRTRSEARQCYYFST